MRKNIIIAAMVATFSLPVMAEKPTTLEVCTSLSSLAGTIMEGRQIGTSMSDMLEVTKGNPVHTAIVMDAFEEPRYSTERMQLRAKQEFENSVMRLCMKQYSE